MKSLLVILVLGMISYTLSDAQSSHWLTGLLFPFLTLFSILALIFWLAARVLAGHHAGGGDGSGGDNRLVRQQLRQRFRRWWLRW